MNARFVYRASHGGGFTLLEVMMGIVIVGVGYLAAMQLFATCSQQNADSLRMTCAASLAGSIRELIARKSFVDPIAGYTEFGRGADETLVSQYDDVDDFDGQVFNPPIDAVDPNNPQTQPSLAAYSQLVSVVPVDIADFSKTLSKTSKNYQAVRVTVNILYKPPGEVPPRNIYSLAWVECRR